MMRMSEGSGQRNALMAWGDVLAPLLTSSWIQDTPIKVAELRALRSSLAVAGQEKRKMEVHSSVMLSIAQWA